MSNPRSTCGEGGYIPHHIPAGPIAPMMTQKHIFYHSLAHNIKNVAPQKQNAICNTRAQYAKRNCAFELFKVNCAATVNVKNASFHKKIVKRKKRHHNFNHRILLSKVYSELRKIQTRVLCSISAGPNHHAITVNLIDFNTKSNHKSCD
jgi:hypothetical protein